MFDTGNTAFMLVASSLVMLMTPGLAFFYGGLVGRKNVLTIMIQSFVSMGVTTIIWWIYGYCLCFSGGAGGIIGNLDKVFLRGVTLNTLCPFGNGNIPEFVFMAYQMMFAIITPALITGAFSNRIRFGAYLAFLVGWLTFVYFPFVHMVWGGGLLAKLGVLDFAGGIVVHNIAGMAALASVLYVGRRRVGDSLPHSIPLVALGTGLLWFGWYGFNAGQRTEGRCRDRPRLPEHGHCRLLCRSDLAAPRLDLRTQAEVPRPADRSGRRTRHDHPVRRLRHAHQRRASSGSSRGWSATSRSISRTA